jgi:hypothetical protein
MVWSIRRFIGADFLLCVSVSFLGNAIGEPLAGLLPSAFSETSLFTLPPEFPTIRFHGTV